MKYLSKNEILNIHNLLVEKYGSEEGITDNTVLDYTISQPVGTFGNNEFYPSVVQKACRLCYGIVREKPFISENKTTGAVTLLTVLKLNNIDLGYTQTELVNIIKGVSNGEIDFKNLVDWVNSLVI